MDIVLVPSVHVNGITRLSRLTGTTDGFRGERGAADMASWTKDPLRYEFRSFT